MKVVLVTGGGGGIGAAICKKFAEHGYTVIATYRSDKEKAEKMLDSLSGNGHKIYKASNTDSDTLSELAKAIKSEYGRMDVLVNNAGITTPVAHEDLDGLTDDWIDRIMQTNFRGAFAMIRAFKPLLQDTGSQDKPSLVVNISSVAGQSGIGSNVAYCASKAAMDSMTRSLGRALAPQVRVVSVAPGWVLGAYTKNIDPAYLKKQTNATPLNKLARAEDVANTVFAVDNYLTFTTGSVIPVEGGRLLGN